MIHFYNNDFQSTPNQNFKSLFDYIFNLDCYQHLGHTIGIVLGGDFNAKIGGGVGPSNLGPSYRRGEELVMFLDQYDLINVMDLMGPAHTLSNQPSTFRGRGRPSTIDFIFISMELADHVVAAEVLVTIHGDHNPIKLALKSAPRPRPSVECGAKDIMPSTDNKVNMEGRGQR